MHISCCCKASDIQALVGILEQEIAITTRWSQVFQAGGIPAPVVESVELDPVICNETREQLLNRILTQKTATFNAMFLG